MSSFPRTPLRAFRSPFCVGKTLLILAALGWSGCATGDYAFVTRISTGEKIQIPLSQGRPLNAKQGSLEVAYAGMRPGLSPESKAMIYFFGITEKSHKAPRSVRVEDVTDEKAVLMVEDLQPVLKENERWGAESRALPLGDPSLHWLTYVDDAMRVFRFTIVDSEGKTTVLNQGWFVPSWAKPAVRHTIGMDAVK